MHGPAFPVIHLNAAHLDGGATNMMIVVRIFRKVLRVDNSAHLPINRES